MSNKRIDALEVDFEKHGEYVETIVDEPITYVVLRLHGFTGVGLMRCGEDDIFSVVFGVSKATRRALKHIDEQRRALRVLTLSDPTRSSLSISNRSMSKHL